MTKKYIMVSHKELSDAFNAFAKRSIATKLYPDLKKILFEPFGSYKTAGKKKVSLTRLYDAANRAGLRQKRADGESSFNLQKYQFAIDILDEVPRIRAFNEAVRKEEMDKRARAAHRALARREKHRNSPLGKLEERVASLERENAALRARMRTPEQERAERDAWLESDTRIGGFPAPRGPGFRD